MASSVVGSTPGIPVPPPPPPAPVRPPVPPPPKALPPHVKAPHVKAVSPNAVPIVDYVRPKEASPEPEQQPPQAKQSPMIFGSESDESEAEAQAAQQWTEMIETVAEMVQEKLENRARVYFSVTDEPIYCERYGCRRLAPPGPTHTRKGAEKAYE